MLSYEDCLALCDLTQEEVDAIAKHEHIPEIVATELGNYLVHDPNGIPAIKRIIQEDIVTAEKTGNRQRTSHLKLVLKHFIDTHPDNTSA